jgi:hypothetical protein
MPVVSFEYVEKYEALTARVAELEAMVQKAYNDGFREGIKEHTTHKGGTPWALSKWPAALSQPAQENPND